MRVLGIESSCDETAVAVYDENQGLILDEVYSQQIHQQYGGVVPELASRDHLRKLAQMIIKSLKEKELKWSDVDAVAYTAGPGLAGALMVGACTSQALAFSLGVPAVAVNHLEGHLLAPLLGGEPIRFPFVCLLVSGGHTQFVLVKSIGQYELLGETLDDAVGEAFDKTAKLLGLGYPGGAALEQLAKKGDACRFALPRPMLKKPTLDMSFSGLKTAVLLTVQKHEEQDYADIAACFQSAIVETLVAKCQRALKQTHAKQIVIAGGVAANGQLRQAIATMASKQSASVLYPPIKHCTDNAAMIAFAGYQQIIAGRHPKVDGLIRPRWPLSELSANF